MCEWKLLGIHKHSLKCAKIPADQLDKFSAPECFRKNRCSYDKHQLSIRLNFRTKNFFVLRYLHNYFQSNDQSVKLARGMLGSICVISINYLCCTDIPSLTGHAMHLGWFFLFEAHKKSERDKKQLQLHWMQIIHVCVF